MYDMKMIFQIRRNSSLIFSIYFFEVEIMQEEYKVNNIFNNDGMTLNDLKEKLFSLFINEDFELFNKCNNIDLDIVPNISIGE